MRNRNKINQLGRTSAHRSALLMNLANALITHKRINTTLAKAKELRGFVEPLITKSKTDTTHSRRMVFRHLQSKDAVTELFREVAPKVGDRPGGYTRIIKTGFRAGDAAEMCMIELVDFNDMYTSDKKAGAKKTRRTRRGGSAATAPKAAEETKAETKAEPKAEAKTDEAESPKAEVAAETAEAKQEPKADTTAEAKQEDDKKEGDK